EGLTKVDPADLGAETSPEAGHGNTAGFDGDGPTLPRVHRFIHEHPPLDLPSRPVGNNFQRRCSVGGCGSTPFYHQNTMALLRPVHWGSILCSRAIADHFARCPSMMVANSAGAS